MRQDAGLVGLLAAMALVGWCLHEEPVEAGAETATARRAVTIEIPASQLGLPLYPDGKAGRATRLEGPDYAIEQLVIESPDAMDRVLSFYGQELPGAGRYGSDDSVLLTDVEQRKVVTVRVDRVDEGTRVMLQKRVEAGAE